MTLYLWFIFFLAVQIIHFLGTWKLYQAAGRKSWEAAIPVYNSVVLMKIMAPPPVLKIFILIKIKNIFLCLFFW
jgi:signal peptidase I